jgi:molybdate transport system substrate-binding protein
VKYFFILILFLFSSCSDEVKKKKVVRVAVSANVGFAILEVEKEFEKENPEIDIQISIGSSGKLSSQIVNKAPYDVFLSANKNYPEKLFEIGFGIQKPEIYAKGSLILLSIKKRDFSKNLEILFSDEIKQIAIANPKTAPYGIASFEVLEKIKYVEKLKEKFVFGESVGQTLTYVTTVTDIGFVAKSSLSNPKLSHLIENENWIDVDSELYNPIYQGVLLITENGRSFYNFLLSKKGKTILKNNGYLVK